MAEYKDITKLAKEIADFKKSVNSPNSDYLTGYLSALSVTEGIIANIPTADVVEVVRCKDCKHAVELDKHCDISRTAYRHCNLLRGDETKYVWHKYKKYYKDYSIVEPDDFCSCGELKEREGK
jgi:hypothetical protein